MVEVLLSIAVVWLGTNGGSMTCSKTKGADEGKVVPLSQGTSSTACSMITCSGSAGLSVGSVESSATLMG